jgi:hypothetical protein
MERGRFWPPRVASIQQRSSDRGRILIIFSIPDKSDSRFAPAMTYTSS